MLSHPGGTPVAFNSRISPVLEGCHRAVVADDDDAGDSCLPAKTALDLLDRDLIGEAAAAQVDDEAGRLLACLLELVGDRVLL